MFEINSLIAPFWHDVDVSRFGTVFYRVSFSNDTLSQANDLVELLFPSVFFDAELVIVVTWYQVAEGNSIGNEVSILENAAHACSIGWASKCGSYR